MAKSDAERFGHRCPYTDKPCLDFACSECEVEAQERQWTEELKRRIEVEDVLEQIRAEIQKLRGCSCYCSDGIIDEVEDIIDKHTRTDAPVTAQN